MDLLAYNLNAERAAEFLKRVRDGADWTEKDQYGKTALDLMPKSREPFFVELMRELARLDARVVAESLRYHIVCPGFREVLQHAIAAGWQPDRHPVPLMHFLSEIPMDKEEAASTFLYLMDSLHLDVNQVHPFGETPLFLVNDPDLVHLLVSRGANTSHRSHGDTALLSAIYSFRKPKSWDTVRALMQYGELDTPGCMGVAPNNLPDYMLPNHPGVSKEQMKQELGITTFRPVMHLNQSLYPMASELWKASQQITREIETNGFQSTWIVSKGQPYPLKKKM
jgi:hypothetical protein